MSEILYVITFSLLGGLISLIGGVLLLLKKVSGDTLMTYATPFAAGALLAAVFLDLLPEAMVETDTRRVLFAALVGLLVFFMAERFLHWFHHHHQHEHSDPSKNLIIIGDIVHNALDGIAIAAAFLISVPTGIVTTVAIAAHEIPQEIGDFGLLLAKGMARGKVLLVNVLSALATVATAVTTYALGSQESLPVGILMGVSAGFLLYVATSDIIPEIHERSVGDKLLGVQPVLLILGVIIVGLSISVAHEYIGHDEVHSDPHSHHEQADDHDHVDHE